MIFETNCGQEYFNAPMNVTYKSTPAYTLECNPIKATILEELNIWYESWCAGSKGPDDICPINTYCDQISETVTIGECFLRNRYTCGYMQWTGVENAQNWQKCTVTLLTSQFLRFTENNTEPEPFPQEIYQYTTNPYANNELGFYTNGTHQINIESGVALGNLGSVGFNTDLETMAMYHYIRTNSQ
jgi:hypothetical protein